MVVLVSGIIKKKWSQGRGDDNKMIKRELEGKE
jgi:hypothetical protein